MCDPKPLYQIRKKYMIRPKNKKTTNHQKSTIPQKKAQTSTLILPYPSPLLPWLDRLPCLTILSAVAVWGGGNGGFKSPVWGRCLESAARRWRPRSRCGWWREFAGSERVVGLLLFHVCFNGFLFVFVGIDRFCWRVDSELIFGDI